MGKSRLVWAFGICTILSTRASACLCFSTPMCSQISAVADSDAVFVGRVTDVWPDRQAIANEYGRLSLPQLKQVILKRWHGTLTAEEERLVRTAKDADAIRPHFGYIQRVRFIVSEVLTGPSVREVYTDVSSCGYRFERGLTYLVNANADGKRYYTGACSRTGRLESDEVVEDLRALRAWRTGKPLPPRIYGRISLGDLRPDTRVRLINDQDQEERVARLSADGRFSIDDLTKRKHRIQVEDSRGKAERVIDLSRFDCFEATPWFSAGWYIAGSPVALESKQVQFILEPPPILVFPKQ